MDQAIALLKTTRPTFYRWLRAGRLKGMKVGRQWRFERSEIDRFLKGEQPRIELRADIRPLIADLEKRLGRKSPKAAPPAPENPLQRAVHLFLRLGASLGASDLHLQPHLDAQDSPTRAVARYRIDGVLHSLVEFDGRLLPPLIEQWKTLCACNPRLSAAPQTGRSMLRLDGNRLDLRISFLPSVLGETMTARYLNPLELLSLDQMDFAPADKEKLVRGIEAPWGLVIISGPVGSGKTTVLYACLRHVTKPEKKVMSIEEPVEHRLPGVIQTQINPAEGLTYASALRGILWSDPDIILVGEIRDREALQLALRATLTGHLVLTTLHIDEAAQALLRLAEMGGEPYAIGSAMRLIVAQRLVRHLCKACSVKDSPRQPALKEAEKIARAGGLDWDALPKAFRKPAGCDQCRGTGYHGRNVIAEALERTPEIAEALGRGAPLDELRSIAVRQGMTTLAADGVRRAAAGQTSLEEVMRVLALGFR
ncbi:MAG: GspE/PulE family protein [Candidatus Sumerlaeota bacterium]|nr:GspE/PulE family protein [Candidatus Sumerlaeota bacterium]